MSFGAFKLSTEVERALELLKSYYLSFEGNPSVVIYQLYSLLCPLICIFFDKWLVFILRLFFSMQLEG